MTQDGLTAGFAMRYSVAVVKPRDTAMIVSVDSAKENMEIFLTEWVSALSVERVKQTSISATTFKLGVHCHQKDPPSTRNTSNKGSLCLRELPL